jgi:uncharacterized protein YbjT (DUF2867 family)
MRRVFIAGGTGYMGQRLIPKLLERRHLVRALARPGSEGKLPPKCEVVTGDALRAASYAEAVAPADTFVHLVGVAHPSPAKAVEFRTVDLAAARASMWAAAAAEVPHFVYVSVAHPAPAMHAYIEVRTECESTLTESGLNATVLRPWYVLGPGHRWPYLLLPGYWIAERIPGARAGALRLGLVTLEQMVNALVGAVEDPCQGVRFVEVPEIRASGAV